MEVSKEELQRHVERMHGGKARFIQSVPVHEEIDGKTVWDGIVNIFDLTGHSVATRAYAWSSAIEGSERRRFYAVLGVPPINSARDAVRAAIVAENPSEQDH
ncbi:MAG: hypothetical protein ACLPWS_07820 [Rhodomicrobium sp.]